MVWDELKKQEKEGQLIRRFVYVLTFKFVFGYYKFNKYYSFNKSNKLIYNLKLFIYNFKINKELNF
jgi:hypothetical protein